MATSTTPDQAKHQLAVEALSRETNVPIERVQEVYYIERAKLEEVARIKTFLPIFTSRKAREALQTESPDDSADAH